MEELRDARTPERIKSWVADFPGWLQVCGVGATNERSLLLMDAGEREAILLVEEKKANLLLIDEKRGRAEAERRGITTTGTLGVLLEAGTRGLLNPETAFQRLRSETPFRATREVQEQFLERCTKLKR